MICWYRILKGNLAPGGAVAKITGKEGLEFTGKARTFDTEDAFVEAVEKGEIKKGEKTVAVLRYLGPKGGPGESNVLYFTSHLLLVRGSKSGRSWESMIQTCLSAPHLFLVPSLVRSFSVLRRSSSLLFLHLPPPDHVSAASPTSFFPFWWKEWGGGCGLGSVCRRASNFLFFWKPALWFSVFLWHAMPNPK